jgi:NADH-quinone oxidoreductase subunit J
VTTTDVLLSALGAVAISAGVMVVTTAHIVRAGLWLVVSLSGVSGCFLVLTAEFVAWVQLLIYIGAVLVLLLFATMMTRAPIGAQANLDRYRWPTALIVLGAFVTLTALLVDDFRWRYTELTDRQVGSAERIGGVIFTDWVFAFEVFSVLLLAALVGAIVVSQLSKHNMPQRSQDEAE